ncbi:MAG: response regulator [Myxococcales bacterium]|nr:response regulator [Myxococcales bacterium]
MTDSNQANPLRLFLIDDDEIDVENVRRALLENEAMFELAVACDGEQALAMLESGQVDPHELIVLLDLNMPRMNGTEFLRALRESERFRRLPVVVLTTSDDDRDKVEAYELNVAGYMLKPVTFTAFVDTMAAVEAYWRLQEFPP